jgi:hypothetical protein
MRRAVIERLGGYDPRIFVWGNELEFTVRALDQGFRHLYLPEVVAVHMKEPPDGEGYAGSRGYRLNVRHLAYVAVKLLHARQATLVLAALAAKALRDAVREDRRALGSLRDVAAGLCEGLRAREPVRSRALSRAYRENIVVFAGPWAIARDPRELIRRDGGRPPGRRQEFYERRPRYYPRATATLRFTESGPGD